MNPITHFLAGWSIAGAAGLGKRERAAVTLAGVLPDIDGVGIVAEKLTSGSGHALTWWSDYHHVLAHNLLFGLLVSAACLPFTARKRTVAALAFLSFHAHILGDVVGGGGPDGDHWPIPYLWPFTKKGLLAWQGQWAINGWQNFVITGLLLLAVFAIARSRGRSPLEMFSGKADAAFVEAVRNRFGA